ncbi:hypothetical protein Cgig2_022170 [Carnegiea gigantea]|uniref:Uncharacterized protein n=1 Tax=Carnegiea gigantea TaxID=171969 RepID=A0A9Q1Q9Z7_9CARY|nr:hypothetical protein Cgig2_022170 [Carnegiea gigantea]
MDQDASLVPQRRSNPWTQLKTFFHKAHRALSKLNKDIFHDLRTQQATARQQQLMANPLNPELIQQERTQRAHYVATSSSSKARISYGDECSKFFFARAKQGKIETYVYELKDESGQLKTGFAEITSIMQQYYQALLGNSTVTRTPLNQQALSQGTILNLEQQLSLNTLIFNKKLILAHRQFQLTKEHIKQKISFPNSRSHAYTTYIDHILR